MEERIPNIIDENILKFSEQISDSYAEFVEIKPAENCEYRRCVENVAKHIERKGGDAISGWEFIRTGNMYLTANAHVVWLSPIGDKIDITPKPNDFPHKGKNIFAKCDNIIIDVYRVPLRRYPLTSSNKVAEFISILEEMEEIRNSVPIGETRYIDDELFLKYKTLENSKNRFLKDFLRKVTRDDDCPCESGLKYKDCCGNNNW